MLSALLTNRRENLTKHESSKMKMFGMAASINDARSVIVSTFYEA